MKNKHGRLPSNFMHMVASSLIYDCFFMPKILEILFGSQMERPVLGWSNRNIQDHLVTIFGGGPLTDQTKKFYSLP